MLSPKPTIDLRNRELFDPVIQKRRKAEERGLKEIKGENSFTAIQLQTAWNDFVKTEIQRNNHRVELLFKKRKIKIDNNVITIKFDSEIQLQQLDDVKEELMYFIRAKVQNKTIVLKAFLQEQDEKEMMYTSSQKFEALKLKYPIIEELKQRLGLDFEF